MSNAKRYKALKTKFDELNRLNEDNKVRMEMLMGKLKKDFKCSDLESARMLFDDLKSKKLRLENKLSKKLDKIEDLMGECDDKS